MPKAREPTLFFTIYAHKHFPGFLPKDHRLVLLEQIDLFAQRHGLRPAGKTWLYQHATDIDLVALHRSPPSYHPLLNLSWEDAKALHQCLVYAHIDTLVFQIVIGRYDPWTGSLTEGWRELVESLRAGFDGRSLESAKHRTFGASLVYWAMADNEIEPGAYANEVCGIAADHRLRCTQTDIGLLWQSDSRTFPEAQSVSQDQWVLVTPRSKDAEAEANSRYNQPRLNSPPDFAIAALARHKFAFEWAQYAQEHENLERMRRSLDRRSRWIIETQRFHGASLSELGGHESLEFQEKLARAANNLADYGHTVGLIKELRRTLQVNRTNFLVNCTALISSEGARQVSLSQHQEEAASLFLAAWQQEKKEEIFRSELGRMQGLCDQIDADIEYAELLIERHTASLRSGSEQLRMAGERELSEISRYHALEAAAVVASLAAVLAVELLRLGHTFEKQPVLSANLILLAVTSSFTIVQMLSGQGRPRTALHRASFATACGFLAGSLVAFIWGQTSFAFGLLNAGAILGGALVGWSMHWRAELSTIRRRRQRRQHKVHTLSALEKLIYAAEELPDLLEDLPPATTYRLKDPASLLAKVERKNAAEAAKLGITVEALRERNEDYKTADIGDAIGIRYVVLPWQVAGVVERVKAVTHPFGVDYKNVTTTLGKKMTFGNGRKVELDDPNYRGKYKGFRMNYKSIHIDVDLWGVGARKDVNLMAEVQVRTPIQNLFASLFHDLMYKETVPKAEEAEGGRPVKGWRRLLRLPFRPFRRMLRCARQATATHGTAAWLVHFFDLWHPWLNRPCARLLIWLSDLELLLFRGVMEWEEAKG